jgi:hypothetical protein
MERRSPRTCDVWLFANRNQSGYPIRGYPLLPYWMSLGHDFVFGIRMQRHCTRHASKQRRHDLCYQSSSMIAMVTRQYLEKFDNGLSAPYDQNRTFSLLRTFPRLLVGVGI